MSDSKQQPVRWNEIVPSPKWIRVQVGGEFIADSNNVLILREQRRPPEYYFPREDVTMEFLEPSDFSSNSDGKGEASYWNIDVDDRDVKNAALSYENPSEKISDLKGYITFKWDKMDAWFEEAEQVLVHPRDPYKRLDTLLSTKHIEVEVAGVKVADSHEPILLFETGLPTRYYLPRVDVRTDLLVPSETITRCPYKGEAHYFSVKVDDQLVEDIAWYYPYPTPEVPKIANLICFYDEHVDAVYIDGELQE